MELIKNPAYKKPELLRLTPKGEDIFAELRERVAKASQKLIKLKATANCNMQLGCKTSRRSTKSDVRVIRSTHHWGFFNPLHPITSAPQGSRGQL